MNNTNALVTTIDLLRHGECTDGHCYRGSSDVALSDKGWQQMHDNIHQLEPVWQKIISSPLSRCMNFAKDLAAKQQLPLIIEPKFKELHFGDWEGRSIEAVWADEPEVVSAWFANPILSPPPNGEAADVFSTRVIAGLTAIVEANKGDHVLLVSHGGVMRALLAYCLAMPLLELNRFDIPYACVSRIQVVSELEQQYYRFIFHNKFQ